MNYDWKKYINAGQYENGFVQGFEANVNEKKAIAIITYLPQFENKTEQSVVLTVLLEGEKKFWTEGMVKNILYDMEEKIKNGENFKYRIFNSLDFMMTQIFYSEKLNELNYLRSGEHNFSESD